MDREKVIKGFTVCSEHGLLNGEDCHGHYEYTDNLADIIKANDYSKQCPYNGCRTGCVKTLAKDVLAMLEKQESVKPIYTGFNMPVSILFRFECKCGAPVMEDQPFCMKCGKQIDWEGL